MNRDLSKIRKDFIKRSLNDDDLIKHPITHFKEWLQNAIEDHEPEPTAMTLSTVSKDGKPSSRIVLLKQVDENTGFYFYTNYLSKKGKQISNNSFAALNFFWPGLERQVKIEGCIKKLSPEQNNEYFYSRPIDSQISAIISNQSQVIQNRQELTDRFNILKNSKAKIIRPEHWGGYVLIPDEIEFWQGRAGRLHDRIRFKLINQQWTKDRLAP